MNSKVFALLGKAQRAGEFRNIMCEFLMNAVPCVCAGFGLFFFFLPVAALFIWESTVYKIFFSSVLAAV